MNPAEAQRLFEQATGLHQRGDLASAEPLYRRLLLAAPSSFALLQMLGVLCGQQGRNEEALKYLAAALKVQPRAGEVWMNYGNVLRALGRPGEALAAYDKGLGLKPGNPDILYSRAAALLESGRLADALAGFDAALRYRPDFAEAMSNRGYVLHELGRLDEALVSFDKTLSLRPRDADTLNKRGILVSQMSRGVEGLANFEQATQIAPGFVEAWCNRANALRHLKRLDEALACCDRALGLRPDFPPALDHRGIVLWELLRYAEALASYDRALALAPGQPDVLNNRSILLRDMKRFDEALDSVDRAIALKPDYAVAHFNRAQALHSLKRFDEALSSYERARALDPSYRFTLGGIAEMALNLCDWDKVAAVAGQLDGATSASIVSPLILLGYGSEPGFQRRATAHFLAGLVPVQPPPMAGKPYGHDRIRVAYLSSDYNRHPVAGQLAELIEKHDRSRFAVTGISFGRDDGSPVRARLVKAFDDFHQMEDRDSKSIARLIRELEIDILVDLGGHTLHSRVDIAAHRPAPLAVSYLGYPATMAAPFMDYILADAIVLPPGQDEFYVEKIVRLPHSYWTGGRDRAIPPPPSRAAAGLPAEGFVFCAFNNHWKTTATLFGIWMRLLSEVPQSVLWLKEAPESLRQRLRAQAAARGLDPARLVFAPALDNDKDHLARQKLADLFLDTLPYNAHATASDALSAGLPLVTYMGVSFSSRVASSMLYAVGLPELVTRSLEDYEALALKLAKDPALLAGLRARLAENLDRAPLFDSARTARAIEAAFVTMHQRAARGEAPQAFAVPDMPA